MTVNIERDTVTVTEKCTFVKPDGNRCKSWPVRGATRCREHGGTGQVALQKVNAERHALAQLKRGLAVPEHWQEEHQALCASPTLLNYTEEIASVILHLRHELSSEQVDAMRLSQLSQTLERLTDRHEKTILTATGTLTKAQAAALFEVARVAMRTLCEQFVPAHLQADYIEAVSRYMREPTK